MHLSHWSKLLAALAIAISIGLGVPVVSALSALSQADFAPYRGELLYLKGGEIWRHDLATDQQQLFLRIPVWRVTHLAHSPDRQALAYAATSTERNRASQILVADPDGANARAVVHEE